MRKVMNKSVKKFFFRLWLVTVVAVLFSLLYGLSTGEMAVAEMMALLQRFVAFVGTLPFILSIPLFFLAYSIHPLFLAPTSALTLSAVIIFGPKLGFVISYLGMLISASVAYLFGHHLHESTVTRKHPLEAKVLHFFHHKLPKHHLFFGLVGMRVIPAVPFDVMNYFSGILRIRFLLFITATALGIIPLLAISVFAGNSLKENKAIYVLIIIVILVTFKVGRFLYHKEREKMKHYSKKKK